MKTFKAFIKDHRLDFVGYACLTILLLIFYRLEIGRPIPIGYPIILALFICAVTTFLKGIRYYRFSAVLKSGNYSDYLLKCDSEQSKECIDKIEEIHRYYNLIHSQQNNQKEQTYAFIAQMAHDMKIPISVISLLLETEGDLQGTDSTLIYQKIKMESDKLLDKLSQLLMFLRVGQFEKDYQIEQVDLITEVRNAINLKKEYFILNKIYPRLNFSQETVPVLTDKKWNGMLLDQIISNAIKYSSIKGQENYIQFDITSKASKVELSITDYGIGIPEYDMGRIFEPFFTGENGRKTQNSSGIGLYLCKIISEKLGHSLTVTSVKDEKTTVMLQYLTKL